MKSLLLPLAALLTAKLMRHRIAKQTSRINPKYPKKCLAPNNSLLKHNLRRKENFTSNKHIMNTAYKRWREAPPEYSHRLLTPDLFLSGPGKVNIFITVLH